MTLTLAQKGLVLLAVPFALLLALIGLVVGLERETAEAQRLQVHTKEVVNQAQHVMARLVDAQSAVRGFVVTRDPAFLGPYEAAAGRWRVDLDELAALVRDNPTQTARVAAIRSLAELVVAWYAATVEAARAGDAGGAAERVREGEGARGMDGLRAEVAAFLAEEDRLGGIRAEAVGQAQNRLSVLLAAGGGTAAVVTVVLALTFHRSVNRRFAVLVENTRRIAAGRELAAPLAGRDEIARLDGALRATAAELGHTAGLLRASAAEVRDLYDHAPCGYHSVGPDGVIVAMNATELRWLGYDAAEVLGRLRFADVVAPDSRATYTAAFARVRDAGAATDVEVELVRRDGTTFPVLLNSSGIRGPDGAFRRSRTTLTDLTARRRAEDEVRRLNEGLEERVRARTAELAEANRELAHRNAENEMFVYTVSHDLRSPLVNLQGFGTELEKGCRRLADLLADPAVPAAVRDPAAALLGGKMEKSLGFIRAAVLRLSGIIEALLRLSRAGRVEYRWEAVDVARVVARVIGSMQATIADRGAAVTAGELPPAWGDPTAVEQVFANLVGNALTYLDPARPGVVEVGCLPGPTDGLLTYYVRDNGLGIAEAHRGKIFQVFQRAHPHVGAGEGIGLAVVARVAERHRGRVWVESEAGAGSTFYVALPAAPAGAG